MYRMQGDQFREMMKTQTEIGAVGMEKRDKLESQVFTIQNSHKFIIK